MEEESTFCIDPPGTFDPSKRWKEHLDELLAMEERQDPLMQSANECVRKGLARAEALEKEKQ